MRWFGKWRRSRAEVWYPEVEFEIVGDPLTPVRWQAAGQAGPLEWQAHMRKRSDDVYWTLRVDGTLTGPESAEGASANPYAAADACRAALRRIVDDHNRFSGG